MLGEWKDTTEIRKIEGTKQVSLSDFFPKGMKLNRFV